MVFDLESHTPVVAKATFIADSATLAGAVTLGAGCSVWFQAVLRGDMDTITIGDGSNIQDCAVIHVDDGFPAAIGSGVTIGHGAILHGCTVGDEVLVGMGSIILNGADIGDGCIVGAGALVTPGKRFEPRSLLVGSPARSVRTVTDEELDEVRANAARYRENAARYLAGLKARTP